MSVAASASESVTYVVRVRGHLDEHWAAWLGGFTLTRHDDGTTTLTGTVADQAQLHGVLAGLRDGGVDLLELRAAGQGEAPQQPGPSLPHPLHTSRLTLRAATIDDAECTWRYRRLDDVNEWLTGSPETFDEYVDRFTEPGRLATTVIVELPAGPVVGDFMLRRHDAWAQSVVAAHAVGQEVELGWVLDPARTGCGYATEAVAELLRHCFEDLRVHRVTAGCFADNEASWQLMERLGMRREAHTRRDALHRRGQWLDSLTYALLADDWASSH